MSIYDNVVASIFINVAISYPIFWIMYYIVAPNGYGAIIGTAGSMLLYAFLCIRHHNKRKTKPLEPIKLLSSYNK